MLRTLYFSLLLACSTLVYSQFADVRGVVIDTVMDYGIYSAEMQLSLNGVAVKTVYTTTGGAYSFTDLKPGNYTLLVKYVGYHQYRTSFSLRPDQSKYLEIILYSEDYLLTDIEVFGQSAPDLGDGGDLPMDGGRTPETPYTSITDYVANDPTLTKRGNDLRFSDGRGDQTRMMQNGAMQIGPVNPRTLGVSQVRAITRGVPARYGDFVGGVIETSFTSFNDSQQRFSFNANSNQWISPYGNNSFESLFYSPLVKRDQKALLGLTHSFYVRHAKDMNPFALPLHQVSSAFIDSVQQRPLQTNEQGNRLPAYYFVQERDVQSSKAKDHSGSFILYNQLDLQYEPTDQVTLSIKPSYQYTRSRSFSFSNSLFNSAKNPLNISHTGKINIEFQHKLRSAFDKDGRSTFDSSRRLSDISYYIVADYQRFNSKRMDPDLKDDIFRYGHLGKFSTAGQELFRYVEEPRLIRDQNGEERMIMGYVEVLGYTDTSLRFSADELNPRNMFNHAIFSEHQISNYDELQEYQGLLNGQSAPTVYSMWYAPGTIVSQYRKSDHQQGMFMGALNLSWHPDGTFENKHDIQFGVMVEQSKRSYYNLNATGLWRLMPQLLNRQYVKLDTDNPYLVYDEHGTFMDTVRYDWLVDPRVQSGFDNNLRTVVGQDNGYHFGGEQFIDVNAVDPDQLKLAMFSADDLWNNGNSYVAYSGYDHLGKLLSGRHSIDDFLNNKEDRFVNAFDPIYQAIWLQDKFVMKDINLRVGVRLERYDANQSVLKDLYSLYPSYSAAEVNTLNNEAVQHPATIGDQYVVYVDDAQSPTAITGYRNGHKWYDATGNEIPSAETIRRNSANGVIQPYLVQPDEQVLSSASFEDYKPELLILPRLSFSFPINRSATFFAYYDKFSQRPSYGQSFAPISSYYFLEQSSNRVLANAALKPIKRTDYLVGFRQLLGKHAMLSLSANYGEVQDDINLVSVDQAYPISYLTYANIDFSTIKAFKAQYQLELDKLFLRASYMLQYADGTGSNVNAALALVQSNQPNLRSLFPLDYDVRHKINANVRLELQDLGGILTHSLFKNSVLNVFMNTQSGSPYTAYINAIPEAQSLGVASRSQIKGNPYGSRLPWITNLDISLVKGFRVGKGFYQVQLNGLNVLNALNVLNVYQYSSSASDDGYLTSAVGKQQLRNQVDPQAFSYLYNLKQNNPTHFGAPRTLSATIRAQF